MRAVAAMLVFALGAGLVSGSRALGAPKPPEPRLRRFALVVSSNDGGRDRVRLRFADSDAAAVADVLRALGGLRDDDLLVVTGASRSSFQASFERVRSQIGKAASGGTRRELIVYYSGHSDEQGLLLGGDRVGYRELRQWLDGTGAEVRIAILDSCASGALIRLRGGTLRPSFLDDVSSNARGYAFLTSSSADESAQESDRIGAAFFTHYLVSGLRGAADTSRDGLVTLAEAYQFAFHETLGRTERTGAGPQHPAYDIQLAGTGELVLTDLRPGGTGANLVIEEKIAGRVYVRDASGRLLVELRKEPIYPVQLGLGPGRYHVTVDADGRAFQANVTLEPGKSTRLGQPQLAIAPTEPAAARGGGRAPLPPGVGPGGAPRQPAVAPPPPPTVAAAAPATPQRRLGIYGGVALRYARLDDRNGMFWGGEAGLLLWRRFVVGLSTTRASVGEAQDFRGIVNMRFDALALRYRFLFEGSRFDLTAGVLVGMGHLSRPPAGIDPGLTTGTTTVVLEQQVEAHVAPTRWLRLGVDLGFRIAPGADSGVAGDIQSITTGLHAQLSWF